MLQATTLLFLVVLSTQASALDSVFGDNPAPLPPEKAFAPSINQSSTDELVVNFEIAPGYYLYRDKTSFSSDGISLGEPAFPEAISHEDDYFGTSYIYRGNTAIPLPLKNAAGANQLVVTVNYQGCADIGLCYPPTSTDITVSLAVAEAKPAAGGGLSEFITSFSNKKRFDNEPLSPQEAFIPSVRTANAEQIELEWLIQPGYYLYRDKLSFEFIDAPDNTINAVDIDPGTMQNDEYFGDVAVLREVASARLSTQHSAATDNLQLKINYQGCADIGICYPPESTVLAVPLTAAAMLSAQATTPKDAAQTDTANTPQTAQAVVSQTAASPQALNNAEAPKSNRPESSPALSEQGRLTTLLDEGNLWLIALTFFGAGLLLAFTACMYPMIPILSSIIVGQGEKITTMKAFGLSLTYVVSMASVYALVGIIVGLSGFNIQPLFQNPWVLSAFAGLFVLLALSMFGLFQLQMPAAIQQKLVSLSNKQQGGSVVGVAIMGMLSALIVGPCVTAPLVAALAYIAKTGNALLGGIALFAIGIGMGAPLLVIGTSAGKLLPKAGGWMSFIQRIFGLILLGVAILMLDRFLPTSIIMMLSAALAIFAAVIFGAMDSTDHNSSLLQKSGKSLGLLALVYGFALMLGALAGSTSFTKPLQGLTGGTGNSSEKQHIVFTQIKGVSGLNSAIEQARLAGKPVMLDFYADWCVSCKEMEALTFTDQRVIDELANVVLLQADVTKNDEEDKALLSQFGLFGPPAILFFDLEGKEIEPSRVVGYVPAQAFSEHLAFTLRP